MQQMQPAPQRNNQPQQRSADPQRAAQAAQGSDFGELSPEAKAEEEAHRALAEEEKVRADKRKQHFLRVEAALKSKPFWPWSQAGKIAGSIKVYAERPPALSAATLEQSHGLHTFIQESRIHGPKPQAAMTIHETKGAAFIQIADTEGNDVFIEVPAELDPVEVAQQILTGLRTGLELAVGDCDPLTIYDGACRAVNFKHIFEKRLVLRTASSNPEGLAFRVSALANMEPLSTQNTAILNGIPADADETRRVFEGDATHADAWAAVAARWSDATAVAGFGAVQGTNTAVLDALVSKKNVLVLIAHADSTQLWFPAPPPEGSSLRTDDLQAISDQIRANKPVVYMYCCESARSDGLQNWATELLRHGATGVYAPQGVIETENTRRLYQRFLHAAGTMNPLAALRIAERDSKCRELEMWIG